MRTWRILVGATLIAACSDQTMTGVNRSAGSVSARDVTVNSNADNARYAIDDVMARIVPALNDADAASGLVAAFAGLQQAVDAGRASDATGLAQAAQAELERYARSAGSAAEVDAMRLALGTIAGQ
jgi:hypothetical protein